MSTATSRSGSASDAGAPPVRRAAAAVVGLGVALLGAAVAVSALYTRADGEIDWSNYVVGIGATVVLLLACVVGAAGHDRVDRAALGGLPGAVGALGAGAMVGTGFLDETWVAWAVGGVVAGVSVLAYLLTRAGAPTVVAVAGLAVLAAEVFVDVVDVPVDDELVAFGAAIVVFTVVVTSLGWLLPHRVLIGVVTGSIAVLGLLGTYALPLYFFGVGALGGPGYGDFALFPDRDLYVGLACSGGLVLFWTLAAWVSGSTGFRVLALVLSTVMAPAVMIWLVVEHPTWWGAGLAAAGAVVLLLAVAAARRGRPRRTTLPRSDEPRRGFFDDDPPPSSSPAAPAEPASTPTDVPPPPRPEDRRD